MNPFDFWQWLQTAVLYCEIKASARVCVGTARQLAIFNSFTFRSMRVFRVLWVRRASICWRGLELAAKPNLAVAMGWNALEHCFWLCNALFTETSAWLHSRFIFRALDALFSWADFVWHRYEVFINWFVCDSVICGALSGKVEDQTVSRQLWRKGILKKSCNILVVLMEDFNRIISSLILIFLSVAKCEIMHFACCAILT